MDAQSFNEQWEAEQDRLSRIEAQLNLMPVHQRARLDAEKNRLEVALARVNGDYLTQDITDRILDSFTLEPETLCTVGGGIRELPQPDDREGWNRLAKRLTDQEELARLCIEAKDADLRLALENEALDAIPASKRMSMARDGVLDQHIAEIVNEKLRARARV